MPDRPASGGATDPAARSRATGGILRRALANAGILLSGKLCAGLMQLATFALAARGLGLEEFGYFSMLVAQVMLLTGLAAFESNQAIVRYGVDHLATGDAAGFQALVKAGTSLDIGAATAATLAAFALPPLIGPAIGWDPNIVAGAQMIAPLAYANAVSTPKGMLRLFGRFGLLTWHAMVTPAARLVGIALAWWSSAGLFTYLVVWLVAGWAGAIVALWLAWREASRRGLLQGISPSLRGLSSANPGVWHFTIFSNLHSSVALIPLQGSTFIVGALLGAGDAGLFKIAREIGTALAKPIDLINQALYPDIARLVRGAEWKRLLRAAVRAGLIAGAAGMAITLVVAIVGRPIIHLLFGPQFVAAAPLLVLLAFATAVRVIAFPADPILYALHKPQIALAISVVTSLLFLAVLILRSSEWLISAGTAFLVMNSTAAALAITVAMALVRRRRAGDEPSVQG